MATKKELLQQMFELFSHGDLMQLVAEAKAEKQQKPVDWHTERKACPRCGHEGPVEADFGTKVIRGVRRAQSWCRTCRATTHYYDKPRKNSVR
jgi:hypothetical protein